MKFLGYVVNHHHSGKDCSCHQEVALQLQEVATYKGKIGKKCLLIQQQLLDTLKQEGEL